MIILLLIKFFGRKNVTLLYSGYLSDINLCGDNGTYSHKKRYAFVKKEKRILFNIFAYGCFGSAGMDWSIFKWFKYKFEDTSYIY